MTISPLCTATVVVKPGSEGGEIAAVRCKRWSCDVCREINRRRVIELARKGQPRALLTLTVRSGDYATPEDAAEALKRGLRLLRLRLKRHAQLSNFEFLAVFEKHKSGYPHLHLLIKGNFLPWKMLRTMWEEITGSYMVDIRKISTVGLAALYCAKYIGKDLSSFEHCKRWWRSRAYNEVTPLTREELLERKRWQKWTANFHQLRFALLWTNWQIVDQGRDRFTFSPRIDRPPSASLDEALRAYGAPAPLWGARK